MRTEFYVFTDFVFIEDYNLAGRLWMSLPSDVGKVYLQMYIHAVCPLYRRVPYPMESWGIGALINMVKQGHTIRLVHSAADARIYLDELKSKGIA